MALKKLLIEKRLWSQYLEVGIGPDPEVFTKAPPMAAVGHLAEVGIHPMSTWNNPEPEVVLVVASSGRIVGATLGNDVNLRDVEGRSALLLGKAKDNNASAAVGPFVRLFDRDFSLDDVRKAEIRLTVDGPDGYRLEGGSAMAKISRDPTELVAATIGPYHQYPDGVVLYLGTMFAPVEDRDVQGPGLHPQGRRHRHRRLAEARAAVEQGRARRRRRAVDVRHRGADAQSGETRVDLVAETDRMRQVDRACFRIDMASSVASHLLADQAIDPRRREQRPLRASVAPEARRSRGRACCGSPCRSCWRPRRRS